MRFLPFLVLAFLVPAAAQGQDVVQSEQADFIVTEVADGLNYPWSVAFLPKGGYLVSERDGRLLHIDADGGKHAVEGLPEVHAKGQGGLFDVILGSDFTADKGWIYWAYAAGDEEENNTEVARGMFDARTHKLSDIKVIFRADPKVRGNNHYGGRLAFGTDGALYISLGDRFDYRDDAQNPDNHLGSVVRINPDGSVPDAGNPFRHKLGAAPEIYTYGHRNVQGMALNPASGKIWIHEHGPKGGDEINVLKAGDNYGWPEVSFGVEYSGAPIPDHTADSDFHEPILHWTPSIAPSGMAFYQGRAFPAWRGDLFVGALAGQHLRRVELNGERVIGQETLLEDLNERIRDVRGGPDGGLYILTDSPSGRLLKLEPPQSPMRK